tara:strand:+ start:166 stop:675 length:510 start_codon:yes stop_codon:yes gene_type:complete
MCEPISIGIAIGATTGAIGAAVTGQDVLTGALMGGVMGGVTGGMGGLDVGGFAGQLGGGILQTTAPAIFGGVTSSAMLGFGLTSLAGSVAMGMLTPQTPDYSQFGYGAQPYEPQGYSSQQAQVTGSGGRQAAAVLASEIKQAKSLRKRQAEVADYGLGMDVAGTGLQIA